MPRGRRPNLALAPTRSLQTQRAFRQRKAEYLSGLEESVRTLTTENEALKRELDEARREIGYLLGNKRARRESPQHRNRTYVAAPPPTPPASASSPPSGTKRACAPASASPRPPPPPAAPGLKEEDCCYDLASCNHKGPVSKDCCAGMVDCDSPVAPPLGLSFLMQGSGEKASECCYGLIECDAEGRVIL